MSSLWGYDTQILQVAVDAVGVLASGVIAGAGSMIAYRSTYGTRPIALVSSHGLKGNGSEGDRYYALLDLEVWNNRTYPIQVRAVTISFPGIELIPDHGAVQGADWLVTGNSVYLRKKDENIAPKGKILFDVEVPFKRRSLDDLEVFVKIKILYFDCISASDRNLHIKYKYEFS